MKAGSSGRWPKDSAFPARSAGRPTDRSPCPSWAPMVLMALGARRLASRSAFKISYYAAAGWCIGDRPGNKRSRVVAPRKMHALATLPLRSLGGRIDWTSLGQASRSSAGRPSDRPYAPSVERTESSVTLFFFGHCLDNVALITANNRASSVSSQTF